MLIDAEFSRDNELNTALKQIVLNAPIIILIDSEDQRIPFEHLIEFIYSRPYGVIVTIGKYYG